MNIASLLRRACPRASLFVFALNAGALVAACAEKRDTEAEAADRARQMRDVSRMLDAMEAPPEPASLTHRPPLRPVPADIAAAPPPKTGRGPHPLATLAVIGATSVTVATWVAFAWRRRRKRAVSRAITPDASIANHFTEDADIIRKTTAAPDWAYQRTAFETPVLQLMEEPVDLLSAPRAPAPAAEPAGQQRTSLLQRLHAPDIAPRLYLSGDRDHPSIRHVGDNADDFSSWETILRDTCEGGDEDATLARWLLPALLWQRAALLARKDAAENYKEAVQWCRRELDACMPSERPWWHAHLLHGELARLARESGATRLLALRELGSHADGDEPPVLHAWIDIHLAWSTWLVGGAARERLGMADQAGTLLAAKDPVSALRRRGEIALRRATLMKGEARLAELDLALSHLSDAASTSGDPSTLLLLADAAHQRAPLLPPAEAGEACSFALAHAFAAGQHAAWHIASLERRLAIQTTHDALPGAVPSDVASTLRRELADARSLLRTGSV